MSKIRIRMLDDYNLPPEIDISTQRWHAVMRQNHDFFHIILLHMPICFTLMDNTSSQINMLYNVKWNRILELNVLTGNYIPVRMSSGWGGGLGGYYGFVVVTLPLRLCPQTLHQTHEKYLLKYFHSHVACRFIYVRGKLGRKMNPAWYLNINPPPPPRLAKLHILALWSIMWQNC